MDYLDAVVTFVKKHYPDDSKDNIVEEIEIFLYGKDRGSLWVSKYMSQEDSSIESLDIEMYKFTLEEDYQGPDISKFQQTIHVNGKNFLFWKKDENTFDHSY